MSAHTPGPWKIVSNNTARDFNRISIRPVTPCVKGVVLPLASVARWDLSDFGGGSGEANARLIAAAPDMLAALQAMMAWHDEHARTYALDAVDDARAAISKATGAAA